VGRKAKFDDGYAKMTIGFSPSAKVRFEEASALLSAKVGHRLSSGETIMLLLDESPTLSAMLKATNKVRSADQK
jgi:hypothetical protein